MRNQITREIFITTKLHPEKVKKASDDEEENLEEEADEDDVEEVIIFSFCVFG